MPPRALSPESSAPSCSSCMAKSFTIRGFADGGVTIAKQMPYKPFVFTSFADAGAPTRAFSATSAYLQKNRGAGGRSPKSPNRNARQAMRMSIQPLDNRQRLPSPLVPCGGSLAIARDWLSTGCWPLVTGHFPVLLSLRNESGFATRTSQHRGRPLPPSLALTGWGCVFAGGCLARLALRSRTLNYRMARKDAR